MAQAPLNSQPGVQRNPHSTRPTSLLAALRKDWALYLFEASELAAFMISACVFTVLLFDPAVTPIHNPWIARLCMGVAMAITAVAIIKSPWGKRSGAHFNPAITLTFLRLGKIGSYDAAFYGVAQFAGAVGGVGIAALILGDRIAVPQVDYAVTVPGVGGVAGAFAAETFMAALLMTTVLFTSNRIRLAPFTPYLVGLLIAAYIFFLAPVSGFSINPARTFGSAIFARVWTALWLYFTAPVLGMFAAAEAYCRLAHPHSLPGSRGYFTHRHLMQRNTQRNVPRNMQRKHL